MELLLWLSCNILCSMTVAPAVVAPGLLHTWWNCECRLVIVRPTTKNGLDNWATQVLRMCHCLCMCPWWDPEQRSSEVECSPKGYSMSSPQWRWQQCGLSCRMTFDLKSKVYGCSVRTDGHTVMGYIEKLVGVWSTPEAKDYGGAVVSFEAFKHWCRHQVCERDSDLNMVSLQVYRSGNLAWQRICLHTCQGPKNKQQQQQQTHITFFLWVGQLELFWW